MKKIVVYAISVLMLLVCFSCHKKQERIYLPVDVWDGHNFSLTGEGYYPVSIIWFKGEMPHKSFCQAKEIKEIIERLQSPEIEGPPPELPLVLGTRNMLCLFYYEGGEYVSRVAVIDFDIDENGFFLGPRGKSQTLAKLLQEKEESGLRRYALYGVPMGPITEEIIDRFEASAAQYAREREQKRKELEAKPFELIDSTLDIFTDPSFDLRNILIRCCDDPDPNHVMVVFGELHVAQWVVGHKINADKVFRYPWSMFSVFEEFKKAERVKSPAVNEYDVIFLNPKDKKGYRIKMAVDKKYVYGEGYRSKQLRRDFAEIGLFEKN